MPSSSHDQADQLRGQLKTLDLSAGRIEFRERGEGRPLVFVHGLAVNGNLWRKAIPPLAEQFRCITPDWPLGAHRLPMHADADLAPKALARLVCEFLERMDLKDVVLVGNDTGGAVCQFAIVHDPSRVGHLVLTPCDAFDNFLPLLFKYLEWGSRVPWALKLLLQPLRLRPLRRLPIAFGLLAKRPIDVWVGDEYVNRILGDPAIYRDAVKVMRGINWRDTVAVAKRLGAFEKPVLLAWPPENPLFPWRFAQRLADAFPNAVLEAVEDSYTFVPEDQPEVLARLIAGACGAAAREAHTARD